MTNETEIRLITPDKKATILLEEGEVMVDELFDELLIPVAIAVGYSPIAINNYIVEQAGMITYDDEKFDEPADIDRKSIGFAPGQIGAEVIDKNEARWMIMIDGDGNFALSLTLTGDEVRAGIEKSDTTFTYTTYGSCIMHLLRDGFIDPDSEYVTELLENTVVPNIPDEWPEDY